MSKDLPKRLTERSGTSHYDDVPDTTTPKRQLIDKLLTETTGHGLDTYVHTARTGRQSWRTIATSITMLTGIDITGQSLQAWTSRDVAPLGGKRSPGRRQSPTAAGSAGNRSRVGPPPSPTREH